MTTKWKFEFGVCPVCHYQFGLREYTVSVGAFSLHEACAEAHKNEVSNENVE